MESMRKGHLFCQASSQLERELIIYRRNIMEPKVPYLLPDLLQTKVIMTIILTEPQKPGVFNLQIIIPV